MKLSVGKRILMFFHWLLSLLVAAAFAVYLLAPDFIMKYYNIVLEALGERNVRIIGIALLAVYAILAIAQLCLIFKRRKRTDRGFITVDSSDSGKTRIAIAAIEQMVRQSVNNIDGITEMKIAIENLDDAIGIRVNAAIVNGSHVPTITMNMQRAIRQFVEMNCGVAVRTVSISINSVTNAPEQTSRRRLGRKQQAAEPVYAPETPAEPAKAEEYVPAAPQDAPWTRATEEPAAPQAAVKQEPTYAAPATFDFDKPYESEFAKDLAAMKAGEAAEASGTYDAEGEPTDSDDGQ